MAIDPPQNNEADTEVPLGDSPAQYASLGSLDTTFTSSLDDWRSAMQAMTPTEGIKLAALTPPEDLKTTPRDSLTGNGANISEKDINAERGDTLKSFTSADKPTIDQLPSGGPHLEGKTKDVVTSWYKTAKTATMEKFDPQSLTAAHRTLPFNTIVDLEFYNPKTGETKFVKGVRINNDGPHVQGNDSAQHVARKPRELDVSPRVAQELGLYDAGIGVVRMTIQKWGDNKYPNGGVHPAGNDFRNKGRELQKYWGRSNFSIYS